MDKKTWGLIVETILAVIIIVILLTGWCNTRGQLDISNHNLQVAQDSIEVLELRNGDLVYEMSSYILEKKDLEKYLDISKAEIRDLEKQLKSKIAYISNLEGQAKYETIYVHDTVKVHGDTTDINIGYRDDWITIAGRTSLIGNLAHTRYDSIVVPTPLRVGLTDNYNIWVESKNPYLTITSIEGAAVQGSSVFQKPKRHSIGLNIGLGLGAGYGVCIPPSGGTVNSGIILGPVVYVGVGYTYKFIEF